MRINRVSVKRPLVESTESRQKRYILHNFRFSIDRTKLIPINVYAVGPV